MTPLTTPVPGGDVDSAPEMTPFFTSIVAFKEEPFGYVVDFVRVEGSSMEVSNWPEMSVLNVGEVLVTVVAE